MKKILLSAIVFVIVAFGSVVALNPDSFESNPPHIDVADEVFWNFKDSLQITLSDESGIQNYQVYMVSGSESRLVESTNPPNSPKHVMIQIPAPKNTMFLSDGGVEIQITATDSSYFGFGNTAKKTIRTTLDTQKPYIDILTHSYKIVRGGSAFVVFQALDDNLAAITLEGGRWQFKPVYFADGGYYAALVAWDVRDNDFNARVIVEDKAGNRSVMPVPFYRVKREYKTSTIKIGNDFIDGKITSLISEINQNSPESLATPADKFSYINKTIRDKNVEIVNLVGQNYNQAMILPTDFALSKFYPLRNGAAVGRFGDHRYFSYENNIIGESYHLGIDFASVKQAPVILSNGGVVAFAGFNGIYGNMVIIDHGLGLMSLYAHLSRIDVHEGQQLESGAQIGNTGLTGLVLGDHLHFATLVQGVESNPTEWLDSKWINDNLFKIIKDAKVLIESHSR